MELLFLGSLLTPQATEVLSAELRPKTLEVFTRYVELTESRIQSELRRPGAFLYVEGLPEPRRSQVLALLERGEIYMEHLHTRDSSGREPDPPDGIIHHWVGAVFIPKANLRQTLDLVQDYDHHQDFYKPEVVRSRLVRRDGNDFKIYYRLRKKKIITVTLNTDHEVHYYPVDATHCYSRSYSTRIAEVENADQPGEHEKPIGHDGGFLWRINSYWWFEERGGGVYVECESISLTRDIPTGLGWLIKPFITSIPKESLQMTLGSTRDALLAKLSGSKGQ
jgi:DNA-binding transcriptional ArsR family regulator